MDNNKDVVQSVSCLFCAGFRARKVKPTDAFIKAEMMAEEHIDSIKKAIQELASGNADSCLDMLADIEEKMHTTLALGELFDIESSGNEAH